MAETITSDDLRNLVPISPSVLKSATGVTALDRKDSIKVLTDRFDTRTVWWKRIFGEGSGFAEQAEMTRFFGFIVDALPKEAREETVLQNIDIRPFFKALEGKTIKGPTGTLDVDTDTLVKLQQTETERIRESLLATVAGTGTDLAARQKQADQLATVPAQVQLVTDVAMPQVQAAASSSTDFAPVAAGAEQMDPTVSVEDLRKAFIQSYSTDLLDLEAIAYQMQGQNALDSVSVDVFEPTTTYFRPGAGGAPTNERMNLRAAVDYLYSGQVTPREITVLQKRMVAAGFFDEVPQGGSPGFVTGDAFDDNTNRAWRNLLAQAFTRQMSVDEVLAEGTQQRRQRLPDLTKNINRSVFNATAQNVIGRNLTDAEQEGVISYIQNLQQEQGLAAADPTLGYDPAVLTEYMTDEFKTELESLGMARGSNTFIAAMKGF